MTQLYEVGCLGAHRALAGLVKISPPRDNGRSSDVVTLTFSDGTTADEPAPCVDKLLKRPVQIMPAEPGISLLHASVSDSAGSLLIKTPVIAWALTVGGEVRPVSPAGVDDDGCEPEDGLFIEMPDGRVFAIDGWAEHYSFNNADAYLQYVVNMDASRREREVAV